MKFSFMLTAFGTSAQRRILLIAFLFFAQNLDGQQSRTSVHQYQVEFAIVNAGLEVTGTIGGVKSEINFDPKNLPQSSVVAIADASTIQTGIGIRDKHLKKKVYFHAEKYPDIQLRSIAFTRSGYRFKGKFELTIKDITKEIIIPFKLIRKGGATWYQGSFEINRLDFHLGETSPILDEKVKVTFEVQALDQFNRIISSPR